MKLAKLVDLKTLERRTSDCRRWYHNASAAGVEVDFEKNVVRDFLKKNSSFAIYK
ncbi:MAG: hypothetical protein LBU90_02255 [Bacteroidales bacterium]|jgi:hypothetical protein|nr:hypothetical protein [Bacteroidales bacterium]